MDTVKEITKRINYKQKIIVIDNDILYEGFINEEGFDSVEDLEVFDFYANTNGEILIYVK